MFGKYVNPNHSRIEGRGSEKQQQHRSHGCPAVLETEAHPHHGPEQEYARRRFFESLESSLRHLPANTARAFELREVWGADTAEICAQLGITPSNSWVLAHRARTRLRERPEIRMLAADAL